LIQISKGTEPKSLEAQRCIPGATYDSPPWDKALLRASLVGEQKALCAFCMQRIYNDPLKMKIAHVLTQGEHPSQQLNYGNLVGACKGGEGNPPTGQHCDTLQGASSLCFNPASNGTPIDTTVGYLADGTIKSSDPDVDDALNRLLGLNKIAFLKNGRKATLDKFQMGIPPGTKSRSWFEKQLAIWSGEDGRSELEPYCGVVIYYLKRKLAV